MIIFSTRDRKRSIGKRTLIKNNNIFTLKGVKKRVIKKISNVVDKIVIL